MTKNIKLFLPKTLGRLAGNEFGEKIYKEQVAPFVDFSDVNEIEIPEYIEDIAISFVQGFTSDIFKEITKEQFSDKFIIKSNEKIANKFLRSVKF